MLIDISITTRGAILRKIKRLNFESLNGTGLVQGTVPEYSSKNKKIKRN